MVPEMLEKLPEALINERKRLGLSQGHLGKLMGLKQQHIQRYEATRYQGASLKRLNEVAIALSRYSANEILKGDR